MTDKKAYLPSLYYSETGFCAQVKRIADKSQEKAFTDAELLKIVGDIEEKETISYGKEQYEAIETALSEKNNDFNRWSRDRENNSNQGYY